MTKPARRRDRVVREVRVQAYGAQHMDLFLSTNIHRHPFLYKGPTRREHPMEQRAHNESRHVPTIQYTFRLPVVAPVGSYIYLPG